MDIYGILVRDKDKGKKRVARRKHTFSLSKKN